MDLNKETERVRTFEKWDSFMDKNHLAKIGFYYIGPDDRVKCHFCGIEIGMWRPEDCPVMEHLKWSIHCNLLRGRKTKNEPIDSAALQELLPKIGYDRCGSKVQSSTSYAETPAPQPQESQIHTFASFDSPSTTIQNREFCIEAHRLLSFENWPVGIKQRPKELAEAGFFYTGQGDRVVCFSCNGGLYHWEEQDVPWEQHAKWYSDCDYVRLVKGQTFINTVVSGGSGGSSTTKVPSSIRTTCKICYSRDYDTVFIPCGHVIACSDCIDLSSKSSKSSKCLYCQQPALVQKIFFA